MDRRNFLKHSTLLIASAAMASPLLGAGKLITGGKAGKLITGMKAGSDSFSFDIVTDEPDKAAVLGEQVIKEAYPHVKRIMVSEYQLAGVHMGDIVYVNGKKLVNYKSGMGDVSSNLREMARELSLPKRMNNPTCIRFYTEKNGISDSYYVFHKNVLVKKLDASLSKRTYYVQGTKGNVVIETKDNKARVIDSSCTHKTCMSMKSISRSQEFIVCIPNEIQVVAV